MDDRYIHESMDGWECDWHECVDAQIDEASQHPLLSSRLSTAHPLLPYPLADSKEELRQQSQESKRPNCDRLTL